MFAALDLGTNNCRLLIVSSDRGRLRIVDHYNRVVRLGEGLYETGQLSQAAMERTMIALRHCASKIEGKRFSAFYAVATEACRRASNADHFLSQVLYETGLNIKVISPREEVELALAGCNSFLYDNVLKRNKTKALLFDIGGGSTEIAWVKIDFARRKYILIGCFSIPVGILTLREQFNIATLQNYYQMFDFVLSKVMEFEAIHRIQAEIVRNQVQFIGVSGTITTLASILLNQNKYNRAAIDGLSLQTAQLKEIIRALLDQKFKETEILSDRYKKRIHYLLPGCAIFDAIHTLWPANDIVVADRGIRDGIIAKMTTNKLRNYYKNHHYLLNQ